MHNSYDNLHTGSRARLAAYRAKRGINWRKARYVTPHGLGYAVEYGVSMCAGDEPALQSMIDLRPSFSTWWAEETARYRLG